jgi:hypothetical protein
LNSEKVQHSTVAQNCFFYSIFRPEILRFGALKVCIDFGLSYSAVSRAVTDVLGDCVDSIFMVGRFQQNQWNSILTNPTHYHLNLNCCGNLRSFLRVSKASDLTVVLK